MPEKNIQSNNQSIKDNFEAIRFPNDVKSNNFINDAFEENKLNNFLLENTLQISRLSTPKLFECTSRVLENLKIKAKFDIEFFVYASEEIQAKCIALSQNKCFIKFSSCLVNLLDEDEFSFVIGHELGHFILGHQNSSHKNSKNDFNSLISSRAKEISVDRIGLIACQELNSSLSAMVKCISGLDSKHLKINIPEFLTQLKDINLSAENNNMYLSHPPMLLRCRALLWFSMLSEYKTINKIDKNELDALNKKIMKDVEIYIDGPIIKMKENMLQNLQLWIFGKKIINSGKFSKAHQKMFINLFGETKLRKFSNFLSLFSRREIPDEVEKKISENLNLIKSNFPDDYSKIVNSVEKKIDSQFKEHQVNLKK